MRLTGLLRSAPRRHLAAATAAALVAAAYGQDCDSVLCPASAGAVTLEVATHGDWIAMSGNQDLVLFERENGAWIERQELPVSGWTSTHHLALEGDTLAVGRILGGGGEVRVFENQGGVWSLTDTLHGPLLHNQFGWDVDIEGDWMAVGVPGENRVEMFQQQAGQWTHTQSLHEPAAVWSFGTVLVLDGARLAVGEPQWSLSRGAVFTYELVAGVWTPSGMLTHPNGAEEDKLGSALTYDGDRLIAGSPGRQGNDGAAFVFEHGAAGWSLIDELPGEVGSNNWYGSALATASSHVVVGVSRGDLDYLNNVGFADVFERTAVGYDHVARLYQPEAQSLSQFCGTMATNGDDLFGGGLVPSGDRAYTRLDLACLTVGGVASYCACTTQGPCGNDAAGVGCENSTGGGALLSAAGTTSVSSDDLVLEATGLPASQFGLIFAGDSETVEAPFGDGYLCLGPPYARLPVRQASAGGVLTEGPGIVGSAPLLPPLGPLTTIGFQCWYRDPGGPCGSGFNLSNGLIITFEL